MSTKAGTVGCIGAGRMGRGIAQCASYFGYEVKLLDAKPRSRTDYGRLRAGAFDEVEASLQSLAKLGAFDAKHVGRLRDRVSVFPREEADAALADADIVFEAVPEVVEHKADAFTLFADHGEREAICASTTSTFLSTMLAAYVAEPRRFLNAHWLNPAFLMPLIELSPAEETSEATIAKVSEFLEAIGKVPVVCKASPGYIVPRIQALAMNEAARIVEEGVASAEDVDKAVTYGFGLRFAVLGLLEFIDWGGGDILFYASRYMAEAMDDDRFRAPDVVVQNMEEGRIGLRSGSGFLDYSNLDVEAYRAERLGQFLGMLKHLGLARPPVL